MTRIVSVEPEARFKGQYNSDMDGVLIKLDDGREIKFGIDDGQSCCEAWGYLYSVDDPKDYIGAVYMGLEEMDNWPKTIEVPGECKSYNNPNEIDCDGGGYQSLVVRTSKGPMEFVVYNSHNGYYAHGTILVEGDEVKHYSL